jgi:hypothetical protein
LSIANKATFLNFASTLQWIITPNLSGRGRDDHSVVKQLFQQHKLMQQSHEDQFQSRDGNSVQISRHSNSTNPKLKSKAQRIAPKCRVFDAIFITSSQFSSIIMKKEDLKS